MVIVNSVSGGKSSAFMALHYPADYNLFAIVRKDDRYSAPKDKGLLRECEDRIPGFIASRELDQTLLNLLRLEQMLGQEIKWVTAYSEQFRPGGVILQPGQENWLPTPLTYDELIRQHRTLPNKLIRFCTEQLKLYAIAWHCYLHLPDSYVLMQIGFRADEGQRVQKMANQCQKINMPLACPVGAKDWRARHQWQAIDWRMPAFPLFDAGIDKLDVNRFWMKKGWDWPKVSNCDGCFFHTDVEINYQADLYPERMAWWDKKEAEIGHTWRHESIAETIKYQQNSLLELFEEEEVNIEFYEQYHAWMQPREPGGSSKVLPLHHQMDLFAAVAAEQPCSCTD